MAKPVEIGLWIVATPIGNLGDITLRAIEVLRAADTVLCEDTRVTGKLLSAHGIGTRMTAYHDHNAAKVRPALMRRLAAGETLALVSDAGTPLVSDPGLKLVQEAAAAGITVRTAPGASALLSALAVAGLPTDRFLFAGFLAPKQGGRRKALAELAAVPATLAFYESARRLPAFLADAAALLGPRQAVVARELTKLHEEARRGTLEDLALAYGAEGPPKGEVVVLIDGPGKVAVSVADLDTQLTAAMAEGSVRDAADRVSAATGLPRRQVYGRALELAAKS